MIETKKFYKGQAVELIGENNPFNGDSGTFDRYGTKQDEGKLFVSVFYPLKNYYRKHWFYSIEVVAESKEV